MKFYGEAPRFIPAKLRIPFSFRGRAAPMKLLNRKPRAFMPKIIFHKLKDKGKNEFWVLLGIVYFHNDVAGKRVTWLPKHCPVGNSFHNPMLV